MVKVAKLIEAGHFSLWDVHILSLCRFPINKITNQSLIGIVDDKGQKQWFMTGKAPRDFIPLLVLRLQSGGRKKNSRRNEAKKKKRKQVQDLK